MTYINCVIGERLVEPICQCCRAINRPARMKPRKRDWLICPVIGACYVARRFTAGSEGAVTHQEVRRSEGALVQS